MRVCDRCQKRLDDGDDASIVVKTRAGSSVGLYVTVDHELCDECVEKIHDEIYKLIYPKTDDTSEVKDNV